MSFTADNSPGTVITITVEAWPVASGLFGEDKSKKYVFEMDVEEHTTLEHLILSLCEKYPPLDKVFIKTCNDGLCCASMGVIIALNEQAILSAKDYKRELRDRDRVLFVLGFAGG